MTPEEEVQRLYDLFGEDEPLDPELEAHRFDDGSLSGIHHPLIISPLHSDKLNAYVNRALAQKREAIERLSAEGRWEHVILMYERPYRLDAICEIAGKITDDEQYWEIVANYWIDSENIRQNESAWVDLFTADRPGREAMMSNEERKALASMPDPIRAYRGYCFEGREWGMSWTLDEEQAEWFGHRFAEFKGEPPRVAEALIMKENVLAYFTSRGEEEIVVMPGMMDILRISLLD